MERYILQGATILSFDPQMPVYDGYAILVEDGRIKEIAPKESFSALEIERLDMDGKVILPGLINAHHHFYSTLVRGLGKMNPSRNFVEVLQNLWWRLDRQLCLDDVYYSALVSILDAIRHGTTTIIDHHASPSAIGGSLSEIAKAVKLGGIRSSLCYEVSDRDGKDARDGGIRENIAWIEACEINNDPQLKALFGMHAAFTLNDESLSMIAEQVKGKACGVHIHAAEADSDEKYNLRHYAKRVVERLDAFGLINDQSILAHGVHLHPAEMEIISERGAALVTNPQSNLNNAVGIADILKMKEKGVLVGLGTDAMTVNMLEELRVGLWAQHLRQINPSCGFMELADTLTRANIEIANRYFDQVGMIRTGYSADFAIMDYNPPTPLNSDTWLGHLIYGISQAMVDTTICGGRVLMWNKQLMIDVDEAEIAAKARELATGLWNRF